MTAPGLRGVLVDAAGTLLHPAEPVARTYRRFAAGYGDVPDETTVGRRIVESMRARRSLRSRDDRWLEFWGAVILDSTGCGEPQLLRDLWDYFARAEAWRLAEGSAVCCEQLRSDGIGLAVVSNWDVRLRPLLRELGADAWFDAIVVSAEEGVDKPDPRIFAVACQRLGIDAADALMVGDSRSNDVDGARAAGLRALHYGVDISGFAALAEHVGSSTNGSPVVPETP